MLAVGLVLFVFTCAKSKTMVEKNVAISVLYMDMANEMRNAKMGTLVQYKNGQIKVVDHADDESIWYQDERPPKGHPIEDEAWEVRRVSKWYSHWYLSRKLHLQEKSK